MAVNAAWSVATTCAPSTTAAATRLIEPDRTSPIAKMPLRLVSSGGRLPVLSAPVNTNPLGSNLMPDPDSQSVFGSAPMNRNRCRMRRRTSSPDVRPRQRTPSSISLRPSKPPMLVFLKKSTLGRPEANQQHPHLGAPMKAGGGSPKTEDDTARIQSNRNHE